GSLPPFRVIYSEAMRAQLRDWSEKAKEAGAVREFAAALRAIEENLAKDPIGWGDPSHRLRHLDLLVFRRIYTFFLVEYGVHEEKRLVFIRRYKLLPKPPFQTGPGEET